MINHLLEMGGGKKMSVREENKSHARIIVARVTG